MSGVAPSPAPRGRRPERSVLSNGTYESLRELILSHEISPGEHINIDQLSRDLGVSQTPVREALARLEADGLVVKQPLRGYAATKLLTVSEVDDLFQFRALIEPWASERAAISRSFHDVSALRAELERGSEAAGLPIDDAYAAMSEHDARFHELIAQMSGSDFVHDAFVRTHCHLHLFRLYRAGSDRIRSGSADAQAVGALFSVYYQPQAGFLALREHEAIAEAIIAGQASEAAALMRQHIESSRIRLAPAIAAIAAGTA